MLMLCIYATESSYFFSFHLEHANGITIYFLLWLMLMLVWLDSRILIAVRSLYSLPTFYFLTDKKDFLIILFSPQHNLFLHFFFLSEHNTKNANDKNTLTQIEEADRGREKESEKRQNYFYQLVKLSRILC